MASRAGRAGAATSLIEVLVSLVVLLVGLLGLIGLQARAQSAEMESYQRSQALVLLQDMVDRINANRKDAHDGKYDIVNNTTNAEAVGAVNGAVGGGSSIATCGGSGAAFDFCEWADQLNGAAERSGGNAVGAMIGARGCVSYDAATEFADSSGSALPGTGIYTVSVAWQGLSETGAPASTLTCGRNAYGTEARRRVAASTLRIGALGAL